MARPKKEKPNRADGLYEVKVTVGKKLDGTLIRKSFYSPLSKEDAKRQADEFKIQSEVSNRTGIGFINREVSFSEWALHWLEAYKKGKVKDHTYDFTYRVNVEKYLVPFFKSSYLRDIKQVDVQNYFNKYPHLAKSTLDKQKLILADIFDKAIYNDLCIKNPVKDIRLQAKPKPERAYWTLANCQKAIEYAKKRADIPAAIGTVIMLESGLRRGELIALRWSDIDFNQRVMRVQRSVVPTTGKLVEGGTKSESSNRTIPLSNDFINFLNHLPKKSIYILSNQQGNLLSPNTFATQFKNFMAGLCDNLGLTPLTPHELRHTFGTVLREKGVDIYTIQKIMGHSDLGVTAEIYVHNDIEVLRSNMKL